MEDNISRYVEEIKEHAAKLLSITEKIGRLEKAGDEDFDVRQNEIKARPEIFGNGVAFLLEFPREKENEISDFLYSYCGEGETPIDFGGKIAIYKRVDKNKEERDAVPLYAKVLAQSVFEETGAKIRVGVGGEAKAEDFYTSLKEAKEALDRALKLKEDGDVFFYRDHTESRILESLSRTTAEKHLQDIMKNGAEKVFNEKDLVATAEKFIDCNLNLSETARKLYIHRNTLTYRLDRIEKITGLDIRNFKDAANFTLAKLLYGLTREN